MVAAAAVLGAGAGALSLLKLWRMRLVLAHRQDEMEKALDALSASIGALQSQLNSAPARDSNREISTELDLEARDSGADRPEPVEVDREEPDDGEQEVTAEIMAVISAAAAEFLGKKIRILSAKLLQAPPESVSAWSQQGRVFVQASHNLRSRG